ncbi:hypothetical protein DUNSADRAFT_10758 [Dunaliella salina]|uniref:Secreted protein n=1 Tax=Dunaliella salina TaxID=3046 RepID=A0ABQ7GEP1_DUNSA|nr:hypothetical protein DUNSADRAFT_10758 [Dunaliella salina]|eukprot:KAF5833052.1 hypothetical protein DUNSADRAFT_10758 [Dunaliella salina]
MAICLCTLLSRVCQCVSLRICSVVSWLCVCVCGAVRPFMVKTCKHASFPSPSRLIGILWDMLVACIYAQYFFIHYLIGDNFQFNRLPCSAHNGKHRRTGLKGKDRKISSSLAKRMS